MLYLFVKTFLFILWNILIGKNKKQKEHLLELFQVAVTRQTDIMVMNILGHGVDIPLLGLREACKELNDGELCELFTDESYAISQCFLMSTSQVCDATFSFVKSFIKKNRISFL